MSVHSQQRVEESPRRLTETASYTGSLVLGGFDESAFEANDVVFNVGDADSLSVQLRSLVVVNSIIGTISPSFGDAGTRMVIDSTLPDLWLPQAVCESLAEALNPTLDSTTGRYLVDSVTHSALLAASPEFTFTLATNESSSETLNIVLPYSAFDLWLLPPVYESPVPYFPIRQAPEGSDFILGRAFLQEAYIVVDWERGNFTLWQVLADEKPPNIVPILPVKQESSDQHTLGTGSIAGVVIGAIAAVCVLVTALWFWRRSRKGKPQEAALQHSMGEKAKTAFDEGNGLSELPGKGASRHELQSNELMELHGDAVKHQLMSRPVFELDSGFRPQELESHTSREWSK